MVRDVAHDCEQEGMNPIVKQNSTRDLSDEVADFILDFCKNAVPAHPIHGFELPDFLEEVKKFLEGEIGLTGASISLPQKPSWPNLFQVTRPPNFYGDSKIRSRARWLAAILNSRAPESIRDESLDKAKQRAPELPVQPIPEAKQPTRIQPLHFIQDGFSPRNRR